MPQEMCGTPVNHVPCWTLGSSSDHTNSIETQSLFALRSHHLKRSRARRCACPMAMTIRTERPPKPKHFKKKSTFGHTIILHITSNRTFNHSQKQVIDFKPLQTKRRSLYLKRQSVPRCKHFSSGLQKPISLCCKWHKSLFVLR